MVVEYDGISQLVRQQFEVCVFTYLAAELKSGDACVVDSENYADFREQLLSWNECQPKLADHNIMRFPDFFVLLSVKLLARK